MDRSLDCNRFIFSIPIVHCSPCLVPDSNEELNDLPEKQPEMGSSEMGNEELTTILVVEDNADMRGYIRSILRDYYNVLEACNGAEAIEILNRQSIDFIVSDLMMPVMDGIELSRRVKETFANSHIPFLMLTAKTLSLIHISEPTRH